MLHGHLAPGGLVDLALTEPHGIDDPGKRDHRTAARQPDEIHVNRKTDEDTYL